MRDGFSRIRHATAADVMLTRSEHSQLIQVHYDDRLGNEQMDSTLPFSRPSTALLTPMRSWSRTT